MKKRRPRLRLVEARYLFHVVGKDDRYQAFSVHAARAGDDLALAVSLQDDEGEGYKPEFFEHVRDAIENVKKLIKANDLEEQTS